MFLRALMFACVRLMFLRALLRTMTSHSLQHFSGRLMIKGRLCVPAQSGPLLLWEQLFLRLRHSRVQILLVTN